MYKRIEDIRNIVTDYEALLKEAERVLYLIGAVDKIYKVEEGSVESVEITCIGGPLEVFVTYGVGCYDSTGLTYPLEYLTLDDSDLVAKVKKDKEERERKKYLLKMEEDRREAERKKVAELKKEAFELIEYKRLKEKYEGTN